MMDAIWSTAQARLSHRLAMHFRVAPLRLAGDQPLVSFTFDDVPRSAATLGADLLDDHGGRGTFYVAGGLVGRPSPEWKMVDADGVCALHEDGHEIGCHTYSHRRACDLDAATMQAEIEGNRRYFRSLDPTINVRNFAYPYGFGSIQRKRQLGEAFDSCRSIVPKVNSGTVDLQFLHAMPLIDDRIGARGIERAFDETVAKGGWLIFYTHDVAPSPSAYGCTPALLRKALEEANRRDVQILNIAEALQCLRV
jgi:peptidoglycan/xylan/chitin deacetylase (PgdA/CDA1 family)